MEVLNDVKPLSKKLRETIPPLKDGEVAIFRLSNAFVKEDSREQPSVREVAQFSGIEQVNDPFDEDGLATKKICTFIKDYKQVGTSGQVKPVYEPVVFIRGEKRVTSDDKAMYEFMMRSKRSAANKFRNIMGAKKGSKPEWVLLGTKELTNAVQLDELKFEAEKMIRGSNFDVLKGIATMLNASVDTRLHVKSYNAGVSVDPQGMKTEIIQLAKLYPKQIISASPDERAKYKVQIYDAMIFGILFFEKKAYHLIDQKEIKELFTPESDIDSIESLIDYFMSEKGKKDYVKFAQALKTALKV